MSPNFYRFLAEILWFNRQSKRAMPQLTSDVTIIDFLDQLGVSKKFVNEYVLPMGAAIWSTSLTDTQDFPAQSFLRFWDNHGLLQLIGGPQWFTIKNGSESYIKAILKKQRFQYFCNANVQSVHRHDSGATIRGENIAPFDCDIVIIATHADQAYRILEQPTSTESKLLGQWSYSKNHNVLHQSDSFLPTQSKYWASWMYHNDSSDQMVATYYMNRLQQIPKDQHYFVTLNSNSIPQSDQLYSNIVEHPMMTTNSMNTQSKLSNLQGQNHTYFCGSYFGYGFHEDAHVAGLNVAKNINSAVAK